MTIETTSALTDVQFPGYALESLPDTETHAQESRNSRESQTALRNAPNAYFGPSWPPISVRRDRSFR